MTVRPTAAARLACTCLIALAAVGASALAVPARATEIVLGRIAPDSTSDPGCINCNAFQRGTSSTAPSYKVPAGKWLITAWATRGGGSAGKARLSVYRKTSVSGQFKLVHQSDIVDVPAHSKAYHPTHLNVQAGDVLGLATISGLTTGAETTNEDNNFFGVGCIPAPGDKVGKGTSCKLTKFPGGLANVKAKLTKQ